MLRGAASLAQRFGATSPTKRATGLTEAELAVVIACESCFRVHGAHPTRQAIRQITGGGRTNTPSILVTQGVLRRVDVAGDGREAAYAVVESWRVALGLVESERAETAAE